MNPEAVKLHITALKKQNGEEEKEPTKQKFANSYNYFVIFNGLTWKKPVYKFDSSARFIIDQARRRLQPTGPRQLNSKVINTLIKLKSSGVANGTEKHVHRLWLSSRSTLRLTLYIERGYR